MNSFAVYYRSNRPAASISRAGLGFDSPSSQCIKDMSSVLASKLPGSFCKSKDAAVPGKASLLLVAMPFVPSSVLVPNSDARSP